MTSAPLAALPPRLEPGARRRLILAGLLLLLLLAIPHALAYAAQGTAWRFGGFFLAADDGATYLAKMRLGLAGDWLYHTPYTFRRSLGAPMFLLYLLTGKLAGGAETTLQFQLLFEALRWLGGLVMIVGTGEFVALFVPPGRGRTLATWAAILGGGLGWLTILGGDLNMVARPLDLLSPETFGFLNLWGLPHLALGRGALLLGLTGYVRAWEAPRPAWRAVLVCAGLWLTAALLTPVAGGVAVGLAALYWLARPDLRRGPQGWVSGLRLALAAAPTLLYGALLALQTYRDPLLAAFTAQLRVVAPGVAAYLQAYALALPAALLGLAVAVRQRGRLLLPALWGVTLPILVSLPIGISRRMADGAWVALVILAWLGWSELRARLSAPPRRLYDGLSAVVYAALFISPALLLLGAYGAARHPAPPLFWPRPLIAAFDYLDANAARGAVVLAAWETSSRLPSHAAVNVITGHDAEGYRPFAYADEVTHFFSAYPAADAAAADRARRALLADTGVVWVVWGPAERALGTWNPQAAPYLRLVYAADGVSLFRVEGGAP